MFTINVANCMGKCHLHLNSSAMCNHCCFVVGGFKYSSFSTLYKASQTSGNFIGRRPSSWIYLQTFIHNSRHSLSYIIWQEDVLQQRQISKENEKVYKVGNEFGLNVIADLNRSVLDNKKEVFRNVVAVKSDNEFLRPGDFGCLVYYYDENNKKIPFAYGVAAVNKKNETYYVCMRLEDGLENLGLLQNVSFKDFLRGTK
ncbi:uncharacterized protein LOC124439077 [Xenia sp. Carnegie-2017]|uniref:uncharacterized protein LOC124439077 n=1 Tax=Xenia sp. Carnegie-2017 TaxID=2897299 RepID=UPI001F0402F1|nr:uncharacterized protein LOC124439077 [Xenia sp. Carnegie-2017]